MKRPRLSAPRLRWLGCLLAALLPLVLASCARLADLPASILGTFATATPTLPALITPLPEITQRPTSIGPSLPVDRPPAATPTGTSSPTPAATVTPSPSPTPTTPPPLESDLLFLTQERLARWNRLTGEIALVSPQTVEYSASAGGKRIALLKRIGLSSESNSLYELAWLDAATGRIYSLVRNTSQVFHLHLSPDGSRLAYTSQQSGGSISILALRQGAEPVKVASCASGMDMACTSQLAWSPDSGALAWSDAIGIWLYEGVGEPSLVFPAAIEIMDPKGGSSRITVAFTSLQWSPLGRYLLGEVSPLDSGVHWLSIFDTSSRRSAEVPGSYTHNASLPASAAWMPDGRLLLALGGGSQPGDQPRLEIWRVLPTRADLLLLQQSIPLQGDDIPVAGFQPAWAAGVSDRHVVFAALPGATVENPVLFGLDLKYNQLEKAVLSRQDIKQVAWAPDGSGALVVDSQAGIWFAAFGQPSPRNLLPLLGEDAHGFTWLPPASSGP